MGKHKKKNKSLFTESDLDSVKKTKPSIDKKNPFGYDFDPSEFDKKSKKHKKKDKDKKEKPKEKKQSKSKNDDYAPDDKPFVFGNSKIGKKILKEIKSKSLRNNFKTDKKLIDEKKFWSKG